MKKTKEGFSFSTLIYNIAIFILIVFISFCAFIFLPVSRNYFDISIIYPDLVNPPKIEEEIKWDQISAHIYAANTKKIKSPEFLFWRETIPEITGSVLLKCDAENETPVFRELPKFNDSLCVIYPIVVPSLKKCGISVNGEKKYFSEGNWIVCDTSRPVYYFNNHMVKPFTILIIYIRRPDKIPRGTSYTYNSIFSQYL